MIGSEFSNEAKFAESLRFANVDRAKLAKLKEALSNSELGVSFLDEKTKEVRSLDKKDALETIDQLMRFV